MKVFKQNIKKILKVILGVGIFLALAAMFVFLIGAKRSLKEILPQFSERTQIIPEPECEPRSISVEEYAVYTALIEKQYVDELDVELIVIEDHTAVFTAEELVEELEYVNQKIPAVRQETFNDFKTKNEQGFPLSNCLNLKVKYWLISKKEIDEIFHDSSGWDKFYKKYPKSQGIITLSRVGFNQEMNKALVYVGNQFDWKGGRGFYILLKKENDTWEIQESVMVWIS